MSWQVCAEFLDKIAQDREKEASGINAAQLPHVIREKLDRSFSANVDRMVERASREYDRSLKRYRLLRETLERNDRDQPTKTWPGDNSGEEASPPGTKGPVGSPAAEEREEQDQDDLSDYLSSFETHLDEMPKSDSQNHKARSEPTAPGGGLTLV